jgi:hypothetical protein
VNKSYTDGTQVWVQSSLKNERRITDYKNNLIWLHKLQSLQVILEDINKYECNNKKADRII